MAPLTFFIIAVALCMVLEKNYCSKVCSSSDEMVPCCLKLSWLVKALANTNASR